MYAGEFQKHLSALALAFEKLQAENVFLQSQLSSSGDATSLPKDGVLLSFDSCAPGPPGVDEQKAEEPEAASAATATAPIVEQGAGGSADSGVAAEEEDRSTDPQCELEDAPSAAATGEVDLQEGPTNGTAMVLPSAIGRQVKRGKSSVAVLDELVHPADPPRDFGVLSPVSIVRCLWDSTAGMFLVFEAWAAPVDLIFYEGADTPAAIDDLLMVSTFFFTADILLNFNTGYVDRSETLVMQRIPIIKNYLKFWFWLDLIATIPFDRINVSAGTPQEGAMAPFLRLGRVVKVLKHIRYLKVLRTVRLMKRHASRKVKLKIWMHVLAPLKYCAWVLKLLFPICAISHVLGSAWAYARSLDGQAEAEAPFRVYFESFWWAFVNLAGGVQGAQSWATGPSLWAMDIMVVFVRLVLLVMGAQLCIAQVLRDQAVEGMRERALEYLRWHKVSFSTQLQVLQCIRETDQVRKQEKAFNYLMSEEMPPSIRGMVSEELWRSRLQTFQLFETISQWDEHAIRDLSLLVREEVVASQVILFKEGDQSPTAFNVIHGEVRSTSSWNADGLGFSVTNGMWLGEMALFNPLLLRSVSAVTRVMTMFMVVPVEGFQQIVISHGLEKRLQSYLKQTLWKGVCPRCGSIGDHWPGECKKVDIADRLEEDSPNERSLSGNLASLRLGGIEGKMGLKQSVSEDVPEKEGARDLIMYLEYEGIGFLAPHLEALGVSTLDDLDQADLGMVNKSLLDRLEPDMRAIFAKHVFKAEMIASFRITTAASVSELLNFGTCRDQHLVFLSHYKKEAGTEAALIRNEIRMLLLEDRGHVGNRFDVPVFLDSENLRNLDLLRKHVQQSHNLLVMLTEGIFTRPWCLVEIVTAQQSGVNLVPVCVGKPGQVFKIPDDEFYQRLSEGSVLGDGAADVLKSCDIELTEVSRCVREVFKRIAQPYEPHASTSIRQAQVTAILGSLKLKGAAQD